MLVHGKKIQQTLMYMDNVAYAKRWYRSDTWCDLPWPRVRDHMARATPGGQVVELTRDQWNLIRHLHVQD